MTRQLGQASYITFVKGLNTEAGPLTFPENSTIEDVNCVLTLKGSHKRRYGIKQEIDGRPLMIGDYITYDDFKDWSLNTYTWKAPGNVGAKTFLVIQVVDRLLFYDISNNSALPLTGTSLIVDLSSLIVDKEQFKETGCSFSSGKGYLFVCGRGLEPCYISYNHSDNSIKLIKLFLKIRDTYGIEDGLDNNTQPKTLSKEHLYNLMNQGWLYANQARTSSVIAEAGTSFFFNDPDDMFYIQKADIYIDNTLFWSGNCFVNVLAGDPIIHFEQPWSPYTAFNDLPAEQRGFLKINASWNLWGDPINIRINSDEDHYMDYLGKPITINFKTREGNILQTITMLFEVTAGFEDISQLQNQTPYQQYYQSQNKYPSNAQQWFVGRTVGQEINTNEVSKFDFGNKRAPRGRFIIDAFTENRNLYVKGLPPKEDTTRIIDTAFMSGRVFYLRQNSILYSQVIEDIKQASMCYTEGDPTSEDSFDVVDTDGGVITITDMGDALALFELQNGLAVFAKNGIWLVTGVASDEGFKATGYSVRKLSNLECISKNSIVNVQGAPVFWATSGIYVITQRDYLGYDIQSLSDQTIQSKYVEIPKHNLKNVVGLYNSGAQRVAWFYDVTTETSLAEKMRETKALIFDVRLQAFYELETDKEEGHPFLCGSYNTPYLSFVSLDDEVFDNDGNLVLDNNENIVYTREAIKNTDLTDAKYLAFDTETVPAGDYILYNNERYIRDPSEDISTTFVKEYGWKNPLTNHVLISNGTATSTDMIQVNESDYENAYYRAPDLDADGRYCWVYVNLSNIRGWTDTEVPEVGDTVWTTSTDSVVRGTISEYHPAPCLHLGEKVSPGVFRLIGFYSTFVYEGYDVATKILRLTSCNFDDTGFKDWGNVNYVSTFTTGANTCGDSFITKDIVYLTTQLSRTEALNLQNNIGNESSCLMQMKWDFEDNEYSHKWTTPVQIYRNRRIFAPGLDTPGFDDISIRMPVITTKHKVRGNGRALQIKFISEPGKNFEVLGWNLVVGARS